VDQLGVSRCGRPRSVSLPVRAASSGDAAHMQRRAEVNVVANIGEGGGECSGDHRGG